MEVETRVVNNELMRLTRFWAQSTRRMGLSSAEMGRLWEEQDMLTQSLPEAF